MSVTYNLTKNLNVSKTPEKSCQLCGYPVFSDYDKCQNLSVNQTLSECSNKGKFGIFFGFYLILGVSIIVGNSLLPILVWKCKDMRVQYNYIKISLAVSDLMIGFVIVASLLPNMVYVIGETKCRILDYVYASKDSSFGVFSGIIVNLSLQSSVLHLLFLSMERFVAIKWPIKHHFRSNKLVFVCIAIVWLLSLAVCLAGYFQKNIFFASFSHLSCIFMMTAMAGSYGNAYVFGALLIPYFLTMLFTVATALIVIKKISKAENIKAKSPCINGEHKKEIIPEIKVFKTTAIMLAVFSAAIIPFVGVVGHFSSSGYYPNICRDIDTPFIISLMILFSGSAGNFIIYNWRDKKFRKNLGIVFLGRKQGTKQRTTTMAARLSKI